MVLKQLTDLRGVSGNEDEVRKFVYEQASKLCDQVRVDKIGNVIAIKKGRNPKAQSTFLSAHMDEVGMIVRGINANGLISYLTVGGLDPRVMVSKRVLIGKDKVPGVIGAKAIHLQSRAEMQTVLGHDQLFIDIGADDKAAAEALVKPGDYISFDSQWVEFGDRMVKAKALDDRVGCYTMLRVLENQYEGDVICAFTVMEEIGTRGAKVAAFQTDADRAIVLEGTTANDLGDVPEAFRVCSAGKGVAISFMDNSSIAHRAMFKAMRDVADQAKVAWQLKSFVSGGNEGGQIQTSKGGTPVVVLSVPCRYIHSPSSVASLDDIDAQHQLVDAFLKANIQIEDKL